MAHFPFPNSTIFLEGMSSLDLDLLVVEMDESVLSQ